MKLNYRGMKVQNNCAGQVGAFPLGRSYEGRRDSPQVGIREHNQLRDAKLLMQIEGRRQIQLDQCLRRGPGGPRWGHPEFPRRGRIFGRDAGTVLCFGGRG